MKTLNRTSSQAEVATAAPGTVIGFLVALLWLGGAGDVAFAQAGVSVSPAITSNTYAGFITLDITGLTNTEQVAVQRWLDANANGAIDDNEPMLETFRIRDGGAMVINGVTNVSVPFDLNGTPGAITTALGFAAPQLLVNLVGQQIFRITSPSGRFSPVSATFTVTNAALPQSIEGVISSNGAAALPYGMAVALALPNTRYVCAAVADANGHYHINLDPGPYVLLAAYPGYHCDQSLAPVITLTNGAKATNNLVATNSAGPFVAGQVVDAANSNALGGVFLGLESGNLFAVAFTDTNGNYAAPVTAGSWRLKPESQQTARRAYVVPENRTVADTTAGSVSNVNFALLKGNALFYGRFTDNVGTPLANLALSASDANHQFQGGGFTDASGRYGVAVVNTTNTPWQVYPSDQNAILADYIVNDPTNRLDAGVFSTGNRFIAVPVTARISGRLTDNQGESVPDVWVYAAADLGGIPYRTSGMTSDANGDFYFGAASGTWNVGLQQQGEQSLAAHSLYDRSFAHEVIIPPTNAIVNITVYPANLPQLGQAVRFSGSQCGFNLYGAIGYNYAIQWSTNLRAAPWPGLTVVSNLPWSPFFVQDSQATNASRFYRAVPGP